MMPALPGLPLQRDSPQLIITNTIVSTMPARHRDRDSGSRRKLSTIRPSACPRRAGMSVHDVLESLDSISRNNHFAPRQCGDIHRPRKRQLVRCSYKQEDHKTSPAILLNISGKRPWTPGRIIV